jgi:ubiquinone biosynthesis protein UbiJ
MPLDGVVTSPLLRKALAAGEERLAKAMGRLLASEGVASGLQSLLSGAAHARGALEKGVSQALHAANLPSREDVAALRKKLDELEAMIDRLAERVDRDRRGGGR